MCNKYAYTCIVGDDMNINNKLYKKQGVHVLATIFTIDKGNVKVLLIKRKNNPYKGYWSLVGGALYNNERLDEAMQREIKEKTSLENVNLYKANIFDEIDRSPIFRMIGISYIGIVDSKKVKVNKITEKTENADWFDIHEVENLAYDGDLILKKNLETLKEQILKTDILKNFYSGTFTIPELKKTYEIILEKELDRRNFRKKILLLLEEVGKETKFDGNKPAKLYKFKRGIKNKNVL